MGKIASTILAQGDGWTAHDVVCSAGPSDRPFEERHTRVSVAIVTAGSFQYRSTTGRAVLTPGAIFLGNAGHCFECGHEHAVGDRCVAFNYAPEFFESVTADAGSWRSGKQFTTPMLPPIRASAGLVAEAVSGLSRRAGVAWEELALRVAAFVSRQASGANRTPTPVTSAAVARVTRVVREIERAPTGDHSLRRLATLAGLSPYHFLRTFRQVTGLTPHQFVKRIRLRGAAMRLAAEKSRVIDVAYDSGFGDVSNFNHAFRGEFGVSPLRWRATGR